jgi:hypothetical protein
MRSLGTLSTAAKVKKRHQGAFASCLVYLPTTDITRREWQVGFGP